MSEVDNLISSIQPDVAEPVKVPVEPTTEPESPAEPAEAENTEAEGDKAPEDEGFEEWDAKRAKNRISRQDKRIAKLTWEKHQLMQQIAERQAQSQTQPLQQQTQQQPQASLDQMPNEADYAGRYDEYVVALSKWEARQETKTFLEQQQQQLAVKTQQEYQAKQLNELVTKADKAAEEFIKTVPDAISAQKDFEELDLSPQVAMAVLSLEDKAPQAVYQLWKAGKLDDLEGAQPMQAMMMLASALATPLTKPVSKAPAPVRSAKGSTSTAVNPDNYSPDELLKLIRKG